jgi:hypothetical protein
MTASGIVTYPGGKNGAGVYQTIISQMPPHEVYIEPFLGGAAIMRLKRPARLNIGVDLDIAALDMAMVATRSHGTAAGDFGRSRRFRRFRRRHRLF